MKKAKDVLKKLTGPRAVPTAIRTRLSSRPETSTGRAPRSKWAHGIPLLNEAESTAEKSEGLRSVSEKAKEFASERGHGTTET
jgi:hypothetical protein